MGKLLFGGHFGRKTFYKALGKNVVLVGICGNCRFNGYLGKLSFEWAFPCEHVHFSGQCLEKIFVSALFLAKIVVSELLAKTVVSQLFLAKMVVSLSSSFQKLSYTYALHCKNCRVSLLTLCKIVVSVFIPAKIVVHRVVSVNYSTLPLTLVIKVCEGWKCGF